MYNIVFKKRVLLIIVSSLFLFLILFLYKNEKTNDVTNYGSTNINLDFKLVEQDPNSRFSLVNIDSENKTLATFTEYNKNYGRELHKNNFWSPESCAAMPNIFLESNHLVVLETVKKIVEGKSLIINNMFIYDYDKNILKKSENIENIVGEIYTNDKQNIIYFTYKQGYLTKNVLNPASFKISTESEYKIAEESPAFRFYIDKKDIYVKIFSKQKSINYKLGNDSLSKLENIPEREFWSVLNEGKKVEMIKNKGKIIFDKAENEEYKTLKITDKNIIVSKLDLSNFYNFQIEKIDIKSKIKKTLYINNNIENNYFLISSE